MDGTIFHILAGGVVFIFLVADLANGYCVFVIVRLFSWFHISYISISISLIASDEFENIGMPTFR